MEEMRQEKADSESRVGSTSARKYSTSPQKVNEVNQTLEIKKISDIMKKLEEP
jgi:ribosomal protein L22